LSRQQQSIKQAATSSHPQEATAAKEARAAKAAKTGGRSIHPTVRVDRIMTDIYIILKFANRMEMSE
jgi:hypothetical protein